MSQRDFARIRQALRPLHVANLLLVVLTLDPRREPKDLDSKYRVLQPQWQELQRALTKTFGKFDFVTTVEAHRNGRPHLNVIIHSRAIAAQLRRKPPNAWDQKERLGPSWWRTYAAQAGWGYRTYLGHVLTKDDAASYVTKFEAGTVIDPATMGEVVKLSQLPVLAPRRMRRVRSSKGFLTAAKLPKDPSVTGKLHQMPHPDIQKARQAEANAKLAAHLWPGNVVPLRR